MVLEIIFVIFIYLVLLFPNYFYLCLISVAFVFSNNEVLTNNPFVSDFFARVMVEAFSTMCFVLKMKI